MEKHGCDEHDSFKVEAGQIINPDCYPSPNEVVCIQVPKVFDQVSLRDCITRHITLIPALGIHNPVFSFKRANNFDIVEVKVISRTDSAAGPDFKKLKLFVRLKYTIFYSDGVNQLRQNDEAAFNLTINEIYCPDGMTIKVEAIVEAFNDVLNAKSGVLSLDIGAFFVVKFCCTVQLLVPSYGYCPVPPEQQNTMTQTCTIFNDREKTPFPKSFFPEQLVYPIIFKDDTQELDD